MLLKIALLIMMAVGSSPAAVPPTTDTPQVTQSVDRLTDTFEQRANEDISPALVMDLVGIKPGMVIGEVGAGRGRVTVHLADRVGEDGRIYANDIDTSSLEYLRSRIKRLGLANVEVVDGLVDDARLPAGTLDMVLMVMVYHHLDKPIPMLRNLLPCLKPGGVLAMVEPSPAHTERGMRDLTRRQVAEEAAEAGYKLETMIEGKFEHENVFILRPADFKK
jgi:ubiquinone/menaquinone biosynthesis C-methylase UbiE